VTTAPAHPDIWARLRRATAARIGLGRSGHGLPTKAMLELEAAQALARDAVHAPLADDAIVAALHGLPTIAVDSKAEDRRTYLARPDLGRRLAPAALARLARGDCDLAIVLADGLSAGAVAACGPPLARALLEQLPDWRVAPIVVARQARVALGDEIGAALGAQLVVVLIGERPGLSAPESLGAYITWRPTVGRRDAERNCISNIRAGGLPVDDAAARIIWLLRAARRLELTGVGLKDDRPIDLGTEALPPPSP
jgi:ethanolamine ammonia-lyase small subunit